MRIEFGIIWKSCQNLLEGVQPEGGFTSNSIFPQQPVIYIIRDPSGKLFDAVMQLFPPSPRPSIFQTYKICTPKDFYITPLSFLHGQNILTNRIRYYTNIRNHYPKLHPAVLESF